MHFSVKEDIIQLTENGMESVFQMDVREYPMRIWKK